MWWGKFWKSIVPFTEGIPWNKLSSTAFVVPVDQVLPNDEEGEERGPPVSCGWWWKLKPGRIGDSISTLSLLPLLSAEAAWLFPADGLSDSDEEELGSDEGVGVEGGGSTCVGSC